ncbi:MAG: CoA-binding protein [Bacteroidota bacterium]|nr:CoA-binding protein [Bacteroidota bacterium]MDP3145794.1 CoA-binding protein [Bacteroidota bacterium]MDP3558428.1 CoA-binding protein [Bacteroidota bacterium]
MKKTLVIGASENIDRYSNKAILSLKNHGHEVIALGIRSGEVAGIKISTNKPQLTDIDTVTLYVGPKNQTEWIDYLIELNPKRIIFNPGTENLDFYIRATQKGIECIEGCTLVMLSIGNY